MNPSSAMTITATMAFTSAAVSRARSHRSLQYCLRNTPILLGKEDLLPRLHRDCTPSIAKVVALVWHSQTLTGSVRHHTKNVHGTIASANFRQLASKSSVQTTQIIVDKHVTQQNAGCTTSNICFSLMHEISHPINIVVSHLDIAFMDSG
jgi:hypothetical protein